MLGQWGFFLVAGLVPELQTAPIEISFHLVAEFITALGLCISGVAILQRKPWATHLYLLCAGMLVYTLLNSPGYFAQRGEWPLVVMFGALLALTFFTLYIFLKRLKPATSTGYLSLWLPLLLTATLFFQPAVALAQVDTPETATSQNASSQSTAQTNAQTNATEPPPATTAELEARIQAVIDEHGVPGAGVVLVDREGIIWEGGFGMADLEAGIPADADTRFRVGSVSKSFIAIAVLTLVEEGRLSLDDEIRTLTPEVIFGNPWEETSPIRLVHTLEHTAGFDDLHFRELAHQDPEISTLDGLNYFPDLRVARWEPGQHFSYSNAGPVIAAYAVEKITEQTFETYTDAVLFEPLGMESAGFFYTEQPGSPLSKSYVPDGMGGDFVAMPYSHIIMRPSGAASMTPGDMGRFVQMLLNRGATPDGDAIVQPESIERKETSHSTLGAQAGLTSGYGLANIPTPWNGYVWRGHDGGIDGFISSYGYMPDYGVGFAYTLNAPNGVAFSEIGDLIRGYLTHDLTPPEPISGEPAASLDAYTGFYETITSRNASTHFLDYLLTILRVENRDGTLVASPLMGTAAELLPVGGHGFRRTEDADMSVIFIPAAPATASAERNSSAWIVQGIFGNYRAVPAWQIWLRWGIAGAALVLMLSAVLFAMVWIPWRVYRWLRYRHQPAETSAQRGSVLRSVRGLPLLAVLTLLGSVVVLTLPTDLLTALGTMSSYSVTFWLLTWLFALLSVAGLAQVLRIPPREAGRFVWIHSFAVAAANTIATIYLAVWGVIGWRTWT